MAMHAAARRAAGLRAVPAAPADGEGGGVLETVVLRLGSGGRGGLSFASNTDLRVCDVERGGRADRAGVRSGWRLVGIDGHAVERLDQVQQLLGALRRGDTGRMKLY